MATDLNSNHARGAECVKQHLGVGRVVAEISNNESIRMVAAIIAASALARAVP
jgi:hypothetical protein